MSMRNRIARLEAARPPEARPMLAYLLRPADADGRPLGLHREGAVFVWVAECPDDGDDLPEIPPALVGLKILDVRCIP